ncbi:Arc family DNA-binding protein [Sphingobium yanoikuyae]|uniref:Arc family DNA-binding protein n=1 Tax=Sphingobium yanoikuyae TaxID=13690 RepID=UPI00055E8949|nr:Arc family DNA-binding protein [Sphingobium yanoikuyae]
MTNRPGRDSEKLLVRFPDGMKARIEEAAKTNGRSMNAEVIALLEIALSNRGKFFREGRDLSEIRSQMEIMAKFIRAQIGDEEADKLGL